MEFVLKLAALIIGVQLVQDPKPCDCQSTQNIKVSESSSISIIEYSKSKCLMDEDIIIDLEPDADVFTQFTVSLWSGHELIYKQTLTGKSTARISSKFVVKKKSKAWIKIEANTPGEHLAYISVSR